MDRLPSNAHSQREQILNWLRREPLTTLQARKELDIMHPAARIQELREQGHNIITYWTTEDTGKGSHRVARYVLLMRVANE
ncbi:MAG: helix-turn-helix domain-containing protein [Methylococcales bacterium]